MKIDVDIKENRILSIDPKLLDILLVGRTRTSDNEVVNILWATDNYIHFGEGGFNVRRFATRALACRERVRYLVNDFGKIVDKIPDDRGWNRGKPGFD